MSTVRINDKIKEEVLPILEELGISLSEAINIFLHQVKLSNGIPFELRKKNVCELNEKNCSYICNHGYLHDYSNLDVKEIEKEAKENKTYNTAKEMIEDILNEE